MFTLFTSYFVFSCIFVPLPYPSFLSRMHHYLSFYVPFVLPRKEWGQGELRASAQVRLFFAHVWRVLGSIADMREKLKLVSLIEVSQREPGSHPCQLIYDINRTHYTCVRRAEHLQLLSSQIPALHRRRLLACQTHYRERMAEVSLCQIHLQFLKGRPTSGHCHRRGKL